MMDNRIPILPAELLELVAPEKPEPDTCWELWLAVTNELLDSEYEGRSHHNVGTYDKGCRGPLCRKANREHPKRRAGETRLNPRLERIYDPVIEYYHTVYRHRLLNDASTMKELA